LDDYSERLDEEGRTFLKNIRSATDQMGHLIEGLLAYSRMERRSLASNQVHPLALVQTLLAEQAEEVTARGVRVIVNMPDVVIKADPEGLGQVLRNLLDNALKFTGKSSDPHIEIGGQEKEKTCVLWVRDNGIGFDMQYHDRIFGIFQRLQKADDYNGTGIGLAIVQKAIQRMGGRIWAESAPGKGATFYLEVPK
jgi:signal transduction histidine kinase